MEKPLTLAEKIYLLAIHPLKGGIVMSAGSGINYVVAGALLLDLQRTGAISVDEKKFMVRTQYPDLSVLRYVLSRVKDPAKPQRIASFIRRLAFSSREMIGNIRRMLIDKGIIRMKERQFLYLIRWKVPELVKGNVVDDLISEIERQVLSRERTQETDLLLSLILPANILRRIFPDREKRENARPILKEITRNNTVARTVEQVIRAAHAAAIAATT